MYQAILEQLVSSVKGAEAALLLDSEGEVVVATGKGDYRHRLIGAYQGLVLTAVQRVIERYQHGPLDYIVRRHEGGIIILRPLKDGYYFIVSLAPDVPVALGLRQSAITQARMNEEL
jgi:predicted regulator of Ras-like GTPase activity (Roadblock/LC7/MglB family)